MRNFFKNFQEYLGLDLNYFIFGGIWTSLSLIVITLCGIILSYLFSHFWPDDVYGRYSFLMTCIGFLSLVALPGMSQAVTQASSEGNTNFFWTAYRLVIKYSLIGSFLLILGSLYFFFRENYVLSLATFLSAFIFPLNSTGNLYIAHLNGEKKFDKATYYSTISQFVFLIFTAASLIFSGSLVIVSFLSLASVSIMNLIFTLITVKKSKIKMPSADLIRLGKHLSISQLFTISADYFDKLLVALFLGFSSNAIYAFALILPAQMHNVYKIFLTLGLPKISSINQKSLNSKLVGKSMQLELLISLSVVFYIISAPLIFKYLYPNYQNAVLISQIFALSLLYFPANLFALNLTKLRDNKALYISNITYNISTLLTLVILLPLLGLLGAALSKIISRVAYASVIIFFFQKQKNSNP